MFTVPVTTPLLLLLLLLGCSSADHLISLKALLACLGLFQKRTIGIWLEKTWSKTCQERNLPRFTWVISINVTRWTGLRVLKVLSFVRLSLPSNPIVCFHGRLLRVWRHPLPNSWLLTKLLLQVVVGGTVVVPDQSRCSGKKHAALFKVEFKCPCCCHNLHELVQPGSAVCQVAGNVLVGLEDGSESYWNL